LFLLVVAHPVILSGVRVAAVDLPQFLRWGRGGGLRRLSRGVAVAVNLIWRVGLFVVVLAAGLAKGAGAVTVVIGVFGGWGGGWRFGGGRGV